jgi:hypothetical protein
MKLSVFALLLVLSASLINAGPLAYGICQTGCNALAVTCYGAAGATMGGKTLEKLRFCQTLKVKCLNSDFWS